MNVGLDLLEIDRMKNKLDNEHFMRRVFTEYERSYIAQKGKQAASTAAGLFCAKEAYAKALGIGLLRLGFHNAEVTHNQFGVPHFAQENVSLSITHTKITAAAVVIIG